MKLLPVEQAVDAGITIRGWRSHSCDRPLLFFLHGNGFCGPVYLPLLTALHKDFDLLMLDVPGQGVSDFVDVSWNQAAELMHQALTRQLDILKPPMTYGMGHSLGGVLTLLSADRHPNTYTSIVLLDPVLLPQRLLLLLDVARRLRITEFVHPLVRTTLKRRRRWPSSIAAREYLRGRKIFYDWSDDALQAYVDYALQSDESGGVELRCHPKTEAHFFATLPRGLWKAVARVACKTTCIMGEDTYPFALEAARKAALITSNITTTLVPGGHCYMQQNPLDAASSIRVAIESNGGATSQHSPRWVS